VDDGTRTTEARAGRVSHDLCECCDLCGVRRAYACVCGPTRVECEPRAQGRGACVNPRTLSLLSASLVRTLPLLWLFVFSSTSRRQLRTVDGVDPQPQQLRPPRSELSRGRTVRERTVNGS
jgi:hypothetical protein